MDTYCHSLLLEIFYYGFSFSVVSASRLDAMQMHLLLNQSSHVSSGLGAASHKNMEVKYDVAVGAELT